MTTSRESFAVPALTAVADADALARWFAGAERGARMLLAEGRVAPRLTLTWLSAAAWEKAGLATVTREPAERGGWRWIVERVATAPGASGDGGVRRSGAAAEPNAPDGTPVSDHILRTIRRHANMGLPAPSLATLAKGAGLNSPANAKYYVGKLERRGAIEIEVRTVAGVGERRRFHSLDSEGRRVKSSGWSR